MKLKNILFMKDILFSVFFVLFIFLNQLFAKDCINDNKIDYFVAKKLFFKKKYIEANSIFTLIVQRNHPNNKYSTKSKIYQLLIKLKFNRKISRRSINILSFKRDQKYYDCAYYIYAVSLHNRSLSLMKKLFYANEVELDLIKVAYTLECLKEIRRKKNVKRVRHDAIKLLRLLKKSEIFGIKYQMKHNRYLAAIERSGKALGERKRIRHPEDFEKLFLRLKCLNQIYLDYFSKESLASIKRNSVKK